MLVILWMVKVAEVAEASTLVAFGIVLMALGPLPPLSAFVVEEEEYTLLEWMPTR